MKIKAYAIKKKGGKAEPFSYERRLSKNDVLAEHNVVDGRFAFKLPLKLDSAKSTPLLSSGLTVYSGIIKANLPNNSIAAVLGIGGLGYLAIQFLHKMGHKVFAFSHSPEKMEMINQLGAEYINSSNLNSLTEHNRKFDFILSTLNVDFDLDTYLQMLKPQGKFCFVAQPLKKLTMSIGLLYDYAQRTIYGNYTGSRKDMMDGKRTGRICTNTMLMKSAPDTRSDGH